MKSFLQYLIEKETISTKELADAGSAAGKLTIYKKSKEAKDEEEKDAEKITDVVDDTKAKNADEYKDIKNILDLCSVVDFKGDEKQFEKYIDEKIEKIDDESFSGLNKTEYSPEEIQVIKELVKNFLKELKYDDVENVGNTFIFEKIGDDIISIIKTNCLNRLSVDSSGNKKYNEWEDIDAKELNETDLKLYAETCNKVESINGKNELKNAKKDAEQTKEMADKAEKKQDETIEKSGEKEEPKEDKEEKTEKDDKNK